MIQTLSQQAKLDLFYINGTDGDEKFFGGNVRLFSLPHIMNFRTKIIRHSLFCYEYNSMITAVMKSEIQYSFVFANDLPTLYPAYCISKKLNAKLVYDSHEIFNETLNQFFPQKTSFLKKIIFNSMLKIMRSHGKRMEKKLLPTTDKFITVNQSILDHFKTICPQLNGRIVMNFPKTSTTPSTSRISFQEKYNWCKDDLIFLYQGSLNEGRGLKLLVNNFHHSKEECKLVIIGDGSLKQILQSLVKDNKTENQIKFIPKVNLSILSSYTQGADVGINLLEDFNSSKKLASPNKLFEYIHSNVPVLASNTIENKRVLNRFNLGFMVENSPDSLLNGISEISQAIKNNKFSINDFNNAKNIYNWRNQESSILELLD